MVSFDVVSLFTSIPVELALRVTNERLQEDDTLTQRTNVSVTNIMKLLEFVLRNSYFTYKQEHYQQTFGCAMGSPVSATVANLVMEYVEESAITTAPHAPRWWYRYVDDSHACLQKENVQEFHDHLNSINHHTQFTKEVEQNNCLSFLDTVTTRVSDRIQVYVYRKPTHTDKYLDFNSHHPLQHKRSVVNTLLDRAEQLPSTNAGKRREERRVIKVLRDNNYPAEFIKSCESRHKAPRHVPSSDNASSERTTPPNSVALPYVKGVSEKIARVLLINNVKVGFKPLNPLRTQFPRPKDKPSPEQTRCVVYKVSCLDCDFAYYGQTDRALNSKHDRNSQNKTLSENKGGSSPNKRGATHLTV